MARDAVAVTSLARSALNSQPAGTSIDPSNGVTIPVAGDLQKLLVRITNTADTDETATVRAGVKPPALAAGVGDLAVTVPATTGDVLLALESSRFTQADGSIWVDFSDDFEGAVSAVRLPKGV